MRYALIGCGRIAVNHIKAAVNNKLEIVAVCDVDLKQIDNLFEKTNYTGHPDRYEDYKKMIEAHPKIELVAIATESGVHAEIALYCIDHGINVIIEKPMAMSMKDAEEIIRRSEEKHVKVSACHQNRFNVAVQEMRKSFRRRKIWKVISRIYSCALESE